MIHIRIEEFEINFFNLSLNVSTFVLEVKKLKFFIHGTAAHRIRNKERHWVRDNSFLPPAMKKGVVFLFSRELELPARRKFSKK